jgi:hypothetical protein
MERFAALCSWWCCPSRGETMSRQAYDLFLTPLSSYTVSYCPLPEGFSPWFVSLVWLVWRFRNSSAAHVFVNLNFNPWLSAMLYFSNSDVWMKTPNNLSSQFRHIFTVCFKCLFSVAVQKPGVLEIARNYKRTTNYLDLLNSCSLCCELITLIIVFWV